jgi:hypothetical protein
MDSRPLRARRTASIAATAAVAMALAVTASASASTYYVSPSGSDTGPGSAASPWRTLAHVRAVSLAPGARVLLRRGATWREQLVMERSGTRANPIVIGAFGSGPAPRITASDCVKIKGDFVVVQGLAVDNCTRAGVTVQGDHVLVRGMWTTHNIAGIEVDDTSSGSRVTHNVVAANNRMNRNTPGGSDDHGAFGILLHGDYTLVDHNRISGSDAASYDYGRDGAAIEVFGARWNRIHANIAINNQAFTELGDSRSINNVYSSNVVRSRLATSAFLITTGAVLGTKAFHNTVVMTGAQGQGFVCSSCSRSVLQLRNNIIQARWKGGYAGGSVDEDYNLYSGGILQFSRGRHSRVAAPRFVSATNLRLLPSSPAVDRGVAGLVRVDVRGRRVPLLGRLGSTARPDLGAYERTTTSP